MQQHHDGGYAQAGMVDVLDNGATADTENGQTPSDEMSAFNTPASWTPPEGNGTSYGFAPEQQQEQQPLES